MENGNDRDHLHRLPVPAYLDIPSEPWMAQAWTLVVSESRWLSSDLSGSTGRVADWGVRP